MPSWAIHLATTTKINKKININNKNIFLFGNILPDVLNGYVIKNISHIVPHREAHIEKAIQVGNHREYRYDLDGFYKNYHNKFSNPLILGYYTHLLTDYYWNNSTYGGRGIFDEDKKLIGLKMNNGEKYIAPIEILKKIKVNDFKIFSKHIYQSNMADIPKYDEKILEYAKEVTWLDIQKQDVLESIKYLDDMVINNGGVLEEENYKIFTEEEMNRKLDESVDFIYNKLKDEKIFK